MEKNIDIVEATRGRIVVLTQTVRATYMHLYTIKSFLFFASKLGDLSRKSGQSRAGSESLRGSLLLCHTNVTFSLKYAP